MDIATDFYILLQREDRRINIVEFSRQLSADMANGGTAQVGNHTLIFKASLTKLRRLNFIIYVPFVRLIIHKS